LRDPHLAARVGPGLRAALHIGQVAADFEVRDRVVAALRAATLELPEDLKTVFLLASALTSDRSTLAERLDQAGRELDRDPRTVRRRLVAANNAVATAIERGGRPQPALEDAWYIESMRSTLDISGVEALSKASKVIVPTQAGLSIISERISLPNVPAHLPLEHEPTIEVLAGGQLMAIQRRGSVWTYQVRLPAPLEVGIPQEIITTIRIPSRRMLAPVLVMVPIRPCRRFELDIDFGRPPKVARVFAVDADYPTALGDEPDAGDLLPIPVDGRMRASFTGLRAGLAYGLRWEWPGSDVA